jgi:hypothetical protein
LRKVKLNFDEFSNDNSFISSFYGISNNDTDLDEVISSLYKNEFLKEKMLDDKRYEISNQHFCQSITKTRGGDLYINPKQIGLFSIEEVSNKGNVEKVNLANSEEHMSIFKILMDLSKIYKTIDYSVMSKTTIEDFTQIINDFYTKEYQNTYNKNIIFTFGKIRNLSKITQEEILNSQLYFDYIRNYTSFLVNFNEKQSDINKYKLDKIMGSDAVKYFPLTPYFTFYAFTSKKMKDFELVQVNKSMGLDWLVTLNGKYKNVDVNDILKENEISYIKSQYENIILFE